MKMIRRPIMVGMRIPKPLPQLVVDPIVELAQVFRFYSLSDNVLDSAARY